MLHLCSNVLAYGNTGAQRVTTNENTTVSAAPVLTCSTSFTQVRDWEDFFKNNFFVHVQLCTAQV